MDRPAKIETWPTEALAKSLAFVYFYLKCCGEFHANKMRVRNRGDGKKILAKMRLRCTIIIRNE